MKYHGDIQIGSTSAGKGDKDRAFNGDKKRSAKAVRDREENFNRIFEGRKIEKHMCAGCNKMKICVRVLYRFDGTIENYCADCRGTIKKKRR